MVDVLIQTFNEELNLPHTLASVSGWANKVFVIDSGSTDRTRELAEAQGAVVVQQAWLGYARQKNWALQNVPFESDWILILDADEAVTPELRDEICEVISRPTPNVRQAAFYLNRVNIFMGRQIRHCAYFPSYNLRLFKRGLARYEEKEVHEHMIVSGPTGYLKGLMLHEDRRGLEHFIAKHNRYSTLEAMEIYRHAEKWPGISKFITDRVSRRRYIKYKVAPKFAVPWMLRFVYMYFIRGGILDRRPGLTLCLLISSYELFIRAKYLELVRTRGKDPTGITGLAVGEGQGKTPANNTVPIAPLTPSPGIPGEGRGEGPDLKSQISNLRSQIPAPDETPGQKQSSPWRLMDNIKRVLWMLTRRWLFRPSFHNWYAWRRMLLSAFGAKLGNNVRIRPTVNVEIPWNLDIADDVVVGDYAILYSLGTITIGRGTVISQYAHLCAGTHDYTTRRFPLLTPPIVIEEDAWIAADAFIGPGVRVGARSVVGARATVVKNVPPDQVVACPAATTVKARILRD